MDNCDPVMLYAASLSGLINVHRPVFRLLPLKLSETTQLDPLVTVSVALLLVADPYAFVTTHR
jgi:hypothetical protein